MKFLTITTLSIALLLPLSVSAKDKTEDAAQTAAKEKTAKTTKKAKKATTKKVEQVQAPAPAPVVAPAPTKKRMVRTSAGILVPALD